MLIISVPFVGAQRQADTMDFSLNIHANWTYLIFSDTVTAQLFGSGPGNAVISVPYDFVQIVNYINDNPKVLEQLKNYGGAMSLVTQDFKYTVENRPLNDYLEYYKVSNDAFNITSILDTEVSMEKAVRIESIVPHNNLKITEYLVLHNDKAYYLQYVANLKDYDTYLTEFEAMVKSFKFKD
ncbi:MAG TPA: hypothetical protein VF248_01490 [Nitrososphaeraceae archaeon]